MGRTQLRPRSQRDVNEVGSGDAVMEGFGIEKLSLILVLVLVFFGAKRIPEIGASFGKGIREFKRGMKDIRGEVEDSVAPPPPDAAPGRTAGVNADAEPKRLRG